MWDNVVEYHAAAAGQPFLGCPDGDPTHFMILDRPWIGCIWELPPFGHERSAWVRHVFGADIADLDAYLADVLPDGPTGRRARPIDAPSAPDRQPANQACTSTTTSVAPALL